jgi:hypothetical protein
MPFVEGGHVARAIAAATSLASTLDLQVADAVVIQNSNTLALRLLPCDVFARTALVGQDVAAFEVQVAQALAAVTAPIASLDHSGARTIKIKCDLSWLSGRGILIWNCTFVQAASGAIVSPTQPQSTQESARTVAAVQALQPAGEPVEQRPGDGFGLSSGISGSDGISPVCWDSPLLTRRDDRAGRSVASPWHDCPLATVPGPYQPGLCRQRRTTCRGRGPARSAAHSHTAVQPADAVTDGPGRRFYARVPGPACRSAR